jgi:hypothetical protein
VVAQLAGGHGGPPLHLKKISTEFKETAHEQHKILQMEHPYFGH